MPKKVNKFLYLNLTYLGFAEIQLKTGWKHSEHFNFIFKAMRPKVSGQASFI